MSRNRFISTGILLLAILAIVNVLSLRFHTRIDLTADKLYTLSEASKNILKNLKSPVTVKAYVTRDLQPQLKVVADRLEEILVEYNQYSSGNVVYEILSPNGNGELESLVREKGIQPLRIQVAEHDKSATQTIYLGVIVSMGSEEEVIPVIGDIATMEFALTRAIKKVSLITKPVVGFISGHGEAPLNYMQELMYMSAMMYDPREIQVNDSTGIPADIRVAAWISPSDSISAGTFSNVDKFLARGGRLFISFNSVDGDIQTKQGTDVATGMEGWLKSKGLEVHDDFVLDRNCGSIQVNYQGYPISIQYPFLPAIKTFADHPSTQGLESIMLIFASSINYAGNPAIKFTPLMKSSNMSNNSPVPADLNFERDWNNSDFVKPPFTVAASLEGKLAGDSISKLIVVTDGDLVINGPQGQGRQLSPDNLNFAMNSLDWMYDDTGLNDLRSKVITNRPLEEISDEKRIMYKYFNLLFPIGLVVIYGLFRAQRRKSLRKKRMNEHYS